MASGTPKPDLIVADLVDIRDHMKTGEICIEKWSQRTNNAMLALEYEVVLHDLRPLKRARVVNWDKTHDLIDGLILKVINSLESGVNTGVHLQNMWADQQFTHPITFTNNVKLGALPLHREIVLEFIQIPDLKPLVRAASNTTQAMQQFSAAIQAMTTVGISVNDFQLPHERIEDLGVAIEPIVAYRDFYPDRNENGDIRLYSRNSEVWNPRKRMYALCVKSGKDAFFNHDAPDVNCTCGIYAFDSPDHEDVNPNAYVFGEVYLWGDVLICESGYRAEFAYPKTIFIVSNGTKTIRYVAQELEDAYGVPTFLVAKKDGQTFASIIDVALTQLAKGGESE